MKTYKTVTRETQEVDAVVCNKCGASRPDDSEGSMWWLPTFEMSFMLSTYEIDLCPRCASEFLESLVVPAEGRDPE